MMQEIDTGKLPEDLEQQAPVHDQLPSVDEIKVDSGRSLGELDLQEQRARSRRPILFGVVVVLMVAFITAMVLGISKNDSNSSSVESSPKGSSSRLQDAIDFLSQGVSQRTALETDGSPQQRAATWIAEEDPLKYPIPSSASSAGSFRFIQRYVLAVLYHALRGPRWRNPVNFLKGVDECNWFELFWTSTGTLVQYGVRCNGYGQVVALRLTGLNLQGSLPSELGELTGLEYVNFFYNLITGTLPSSLKKLTNMDYMTFHYNFLTGSVPWWLGHLPNLRVLGLSNNEFSGSISSSLTQLSKIETLALDDNNMTGKISLLNELTSLQNLYLEDNQFVGVMDDTFLADLTALVKLDLSDNLFGGTLPPHLLGLENLTILDVHDNKLAGSLPENIAENTVLEVLALHGNEISETIPQTIQNLRMLKHLDLSENALIGDVNPVLGKMTNLTYLFLADNKFDDGPIPSFVQNLTSLRELSLKRTKRSGRIPDWIGTLDKLIFLDLDDNQVTGTIPASVGDLQQLRFLLLNRNQLNGTVPEELKQLSRLDMLLLDNNTITGTADFMCPLQNPVTLQAFIADCGGDDPEVTCTCCSLCCEDSGKECNDGDLLAQNDPIWERGYGRDIYVFGEEITFDQNGQVDSP